MIIYLHLLRTNILYYIYSKLNMKKNVPLFWNRFLSHQLKKGVLISVASCPTLRIPYCPSIITSIY